MRRPSGEGLFAAGVFGAWLLYVLVYLGITVAIVYAIFHFIAKYW